MVPERAFTFERGDATRASATARPRTEMQAAESLLVLKDDTGGAHLVPVDEVEAPVAVIILVRAKLRHAVGSDAVERMPQRDEVVVQRGLVREQRDAELVANVLVALGPRDSGAERDEPEQLVGP